MSIRAYRVIEIKRSEAESFNLWHDEKFIDYLRTHEAMDSLNMDGVGMIDIPIKVLKGGLHLLEGDCRRQVEVDIAWAEKEGNEWILYDCF